MGGNNFQQQYLQSNNSMLGTNYMNNNRSFRELQSQNLIYKKQVGEVKLENISLQKDLEMMKSEISKCLERTKLTEEFMDKIRKDFDKSESNSTFRIT